MYFIIRDERDRKHIVYDHNFCREEDVSKMFRSADLRKVVNFKASQQNIIKYFKLENA